jgi:DNA (cytosine-5)-methyltransferase 1
MNELALFAGSGGGILGGHLLRWRTVCAVERDAYSVQVLAQRQNDGALPTFPIWSDVCSFDGRPWRGLVDVVSGGFPCQDISAAGTGAGIDGERSGLWREMARIIGEVRPEEVYLENSPLLVGRGLALVLGDLTEMGYDAQWCIVSASDLGAPHQRERIWLIAYANGSRHPKRRMPIGAPKEVVGLGIGPQELADAGSEHVQRIIPSGADTKIRSRQIERSIGPCGDGFRRWPTEPGMGRVADGVAYRVDRIKALGNGQVPRVAAATYHVLSRA